MHSESEKNYFQNRNKIIGTNGVQYIGIPALTSGHMTGMIKTTEIALKTNANWRNKYINTIMLSYSKYPYFDEVFPILEKALKIDSKYVCDINIAIIKAFADKLGFHPQYVRSSELNVSGLKSELMLNICKKVQAYHQMKSKEFVPYMSSLDLFMNCGFEEGCKIIMEGNEEVSIN